MSEPEDDFWLIDEGDIDRSGASAPLAGGHTLNAHSDLDLLSDTVASTARSTPATEPRNSPFVEELRRDPFAEEPRHDPFVDPEDPFQEDPFQEDPFHAPEEHELDSLDPVSGAAMAAADEELRRDLAASDGSRFDIRRLWRRYVLRRRDGSGASRDASTRTVHLNDAQQGKRFKTNYISTTKYNVATFLPKFLFEQFTKNANLFFLATALIQQVPHVSPTNRYTTIGTLIIVLIVSGVKELAEDWKRWVGDKELNNSKVFVLDAEAGYWRVKKWSQLRVGDTLRVEKEQPLPADVVILSTSEPKGLCYIETANLDGETNLKIKQARPETAALTTDDALMQIAGNTIESEQPNSSLYTYEGTLTLNSTTIPLGVDQMLLRGTSLRNTEWIIGVVVFTGHETKLMRNATATPIKRTALEHMIDLQIIFLFMLLITMSVLSSLGNVIKLHQWRKSMWYLHLASTNSGTTFGSDLLTYWILFSNLVPISLFVTIDIIKYWQGQLISSDLEMYDRTTDQPAVCRTSSLVEELGQIKFIFSDKTGTLTRNIMAFKACCVEGQIYAHEVPEEKRGEYTTFDGFGQDSASRLFLTLLATCHTVIPQHNEDGKIEYQASSPDEGALVDGAAQLGMPFIARSPEGLTIDTPTGQEEYRLLQVCEFNSTRKRMSTVLRCPDGRVRVFTKGADTVIFERLRDPHAEDEVTSALEDFASMGLRTLCLAQREVGEDEYIAWAQRYTAAATSLENRSEKLAAVADEIEQNLELVGVTAIEDKLQDGVPETIHSLQDAGIKIWVLTGDRQETAINVGMSSKLLSEDMTLLVVNEPTPEGVYENIRSKLAIVEQVEGNASDYDSLALVIDGHSLTYALDPAISDDFLKLAVLCKAVICCRVSPLQKALVVKLAKRKLDALLLAIGDGANDVSMIQAAHVGVGICGLEGQQAARSADIAIAQFRFLKRLLLVHGSWSYNRLSRAVLYSFYKNITLYITQFWFVFYNGFSGESIYESWTVTFYNVFSTALPPFAIGVLDQFVSARLLEQYPQLYRLGQKGVFLNTRQFWEWIINGIFHSVIVFWFSLGAYEIGNVLTNGKLANHWVWGGAMYTACVFTVLGKAALITNVWNTYTMIAIPGSVMFWLIGYPIYAEIGPRVGVGRENRGLIPALYPTVVFWALALLIPVTCLLRDIAWKYWRRMYVPEYYHYVQEIQKYNLGDQRPRLDQFQKAIRKVRQVSRLRKQRGFAFSAADEGAERVVRAYDRT